MDSVSPDNDLIISRLALVGRLTGHVVHDVNNTLSPLVGKIQILRMRQSPDLENLSADLEIMETESISASRRLQVLSQLSREALVIEPPKPIVISDCVREMEFLVGHHLQRRGFEVDLGMDSSMPAAAACSIDVKLVIGGFMIAALTAAPSGGLFRIESSHENEDHISLYLTVEGLENQFVIPHELKSLIRAVSTHIRIDLSAAESGRITLGFQPA